MADDYGLQKSKLNSQGRLVFVNNESFYQAISDGFFMVKIPDDIDLTPGDNFAQNFYLKKQMHGSALNEYKGFFNYTPDKFDFPHEGYYLREVDQTEQFFLEKRFWKSIYPKKLVLLAKKMDCLALDILRNIFMFLNIPKQYWDKATGGCINGKGTHHLTFNHFRAEKDARGLNVHKDSGWVTILRSIEPGLEAFINKKWCAITPEPGYFIVNFGCAMEILTKKLNTPVAAVIHRVVKQVKSNNNSEDRYSYALFTDNSLDEKTCKGLYEYHENNGLTLKMNFNRFLNEILQATYKEDTVGLY